MLLHETEFKVKVIFIQLALVFAWYLITKITKISVAVGGAREWRHGSVLYAVQLLIVHIRFLFAQVFLNAMLIGIIIPFYSDSR